MSRVDSTATTVFSVETDSKVLDPSDPENLSTILIIAGFGARELSGIKKLTKPSHVKKANTIASKYGTLKEWIITRKYVDKSVLIAC